MVETKKEWYPLYYDLPFKKIFGCNENIIYTTNMLESLFNLEKGSLDGSTITNSVKLDKETIEKKQFELDILLETPTNTTYILEMQQYYDKDAEIKNTLYVAKIFSNKLNSGEDYKDIRPVKLINFIKNNTVHKTNKIINSYHIRNDENQNDVLAEKEFQILTIDIDQKTQESYNINTEFEEWRKIIGSNGKKELETLVNELNNPLLKNVYKELKEFMGNEYVQDYSRQERLIKSQINSSREEGLIEGKQEEKIEIARNLIKNTNLTLEDISLCTGLSLEKLQKLQEELK